MDRPMRKPMRLREYDYSSPGAYFITICTRGRRCILSEITAPSAENVGAGVLDGPRVHPSSIGEIVEETIREINAHYTHLTVDRYVIMPNHIHLLVRILGDGPSGTPAPTNAAIPSFVSTLKRITNRKCGFPLWQRSFYDHVVRNETEYREIGEYIETNPARWREDRFYPDE